MRNFAYFKRKIKGQYLCHIFQYVFMDFHETLVKTKGALVFLTCYYKGESSTFLFGYIFVLFWRLKC